MAEFVRDDIEIQRIGRMASVGKPMRADFHEAVAGVGVVEPRQDGDLQPAVIRREMPFDPPAEVAFPDVQHEPHCPEHVRFGKFRRSRNEMIEMTFCVRNYRRQHRPFPGRKIKIRGAQRPGIHTVGEALAHRVHEMHASVGRPGPDRARRLRNAHHFRRPLGVYVWRLRVKPKPYAPFAAGHFAAPKIYLPNNMFKREQILADVKRFGRPLAR